LGTKGSVAGLFPAQASSDVLGDFLVEMKLNLIV
jgi:hypothetical protein